MALSAHVETLQGKHSTLEEKIQSELRSPMPDTLRIANLKKQKLQIKDQISEFGQIKA